MGHHVEEVTEVPEGITFLEYIKNIFRVVKTSLTGMFITIKYVLAKSPTTLEYPEVREVLPETARMRLYNDTLNCIACNMCAISCPVDCIYITSFARPKDLEVPKTSNGNAKRQVLVQYTIDTALCCYCGLCTTVCPTESLTHSYDYEFSQYTVQLMKYDYTSEELIAWRDRIVQK
jgi:NADH-quinone oxidoreductase subunit I